MSLMPDWMKRRGSPAEHERRSGSVSSDAPKPHGRVMSGKYVLLYKYLENRYADTVVLTFAEIEDLLGFTLPDQARLQQEWWTERETGSAETNYSDSWILASRTAKPNLMAKIVVFERTS